MQRGTRIPDSIADFLAVESFLNGFGKWRLTKMLSEKGIDISHESVRRAKNTRRRELELRLSEALKRLRSKNELEALHTRLTLRLIDLIVSNAKLATIKRFYEKYLELTLRTLKTLFDADMDYSSILKNVELTDMFIHHYEIDTGENFEAKYRTAIDKFIEAFKLMSFIELKEKGKAQLEGLKESLKALYEACTKAVDDRIAFGLGEKDFFFLMIKGMLGPDEDYLSWRSTDEANERNEDKHETREEGE